MSKLLISLIFFTLSQTGFAQSFTKVVEQTQDDGQVLLVESIARVDQQSLVLELNIYDKLSGSSLWEQEKNWEIERQEPGYIDAVNMRTGGSAATLMFDQDAIEEFQNAYDSNQDIQEMFEDAKRYNNVSCELPFTQYEAIFLETNLSFTTLVQALCY